MTRLRRAGMILAGIVVSLPGLGGAWPASASITQVEPHPGDPTRSAAHPVETVVRTIAAGGMHGWQIALITIVAALVGAAAAVTLDRRRPRLGIRP